MKSAVIKFILLFAWMLFIFLLSNEPATSSTARSDVILDAVRSVNAPFLQDATEFIVRKAAHFIAYLILGILLLVAVKDSKRKVQKTALVALAIAFLYACSDEIHQLFVPGRSGQVTDVLLDTIGAAVGIALCSFFVSRKTDSNSGKNN